MSATLGSSSGIFAVIPAAGSSTRLQANVSKAFIKLSRDKTVLELTLENLCATKLLSGIVVAIRPEDREEVNKVLERIESCCPLKVVEGGSTRQESVFKALEHIRGEAKYVLIHDAARPLCSSEDIAAVAKEMINSGSAILAEPVKYTLKRVDPSGKEILATVPRNNLWLAHTPQAFSFDLIYRAHKKAVEDDFSATDDSELVERLGKQVTIIPSTSANLKITTRDDLQLARKIIDN